MNTPPADITPLIHTTRGNLPIAELQLGVRWEETSEYVKLVETYTYEGEIVRESAHVLSRRGVIAEPVAAAIL